MLYTLLVVFVVGVAVWGTIIINDVRDGQTQDCIDRAEIIQKQNEQANTLIAIEQDNPFAAQGPAEAQIVERRIAAWKATILPELVCGDGGPVEPR